MDDYREIQRQKWLKQQEEKAAADGSTSGGAGSAADSAGSTASSAGSTAGGGYSAPPAPLAPAPSATPSTASSAAPVVGAAAPKAAASSSSGQASSAPSSGTKVKRIHILPLDTMPPSVASGQGLLQLLGPDLKRLRNEGTLITSPMVIRASNHNFVVMKCEPDMCALGPETDYYVDGGAVLRFTKVQFLALRELNTAADAGDSAELFRDYVQPYFKSIVETTQNPVAAGPKILQLLEVGETVEIFDMKFLVQAAEPATVVMGAVDQDTMIFVDWDSTPEFEKIHMVPFQDTLPNAYQYDIFNDYLKPYLSRNQQLRFSVNDQFTYQGVQFKVVCCEPQGPARVGPNTTIYCEGVLHPSLRNLLPPELLLQLSNLPPGLQMLLLSTDALSGDYEERLMEVQDMLNNRRGMAAENIGRLETYIFKDRRADSSQTQCMVCLGDFEDDDEVRKLPCSHVFHKGCIDEWLRRCSDCPICKANVDPLRQGQGASSGSR